MKMIKIVGCAGFLAVALPLFVSAVVTESAQARIESANTEGNSVHRVTHALADDAVYTATVTSSGYKWGQKQFGSTPREIGAESKSSKSGYKWAKSSAAAKLNPVISASYAEQAANPWGRRDFSEQAANPWGRRDFSEQAANPWGRRDFSEQAANPWGRR